MCLSCIAVQEASLKLAFLFQKKCKFGQDITTTILFFTLLLRRMQVIVRKGKDPLTFIDKRSAAGYSLFAALERAENDNHCAKTTILKNRVSHHERFP